MCNSNIRRILHTTAELRRRIDRTTASDGLMNKALESTTVPITRCNIVRNNASQENTIYHFDSGIRSHFTFVWFLLKSNSPTIAAKSDLRGTIRSFNLTA